MKCLGASWGTGHTSLGSCVFFMSGACPFDKILHCCTYLSMISSVINVVFLLQSNKMTLVRVVDHKLN